MSHVVGAKGQVVIAKSIREQLGIEQGWVTIQRLVDDHVELYFVPPEHRRSLKGCLASYVKQSVPEPDWRRARAQAWSEAVGQQIDEDEL